LEYEKRPERNERKSDRMIPSGLLLGVEHREGGEHQEVFGKAAVAWAKSVENARCG
jgi:hypothetical protein